MSAYKKHSVLEVSWVDSHGVTAMWEWQDDYDEGLAAIKTIGYFVQRKDKVLYLAQSISEQQYGRIIKIPTGCIQSVTELAKP